MKKIMRLAAWIFVMAVSYPVFNAKAVVIEGTTPSGKFKTVGLDEQGNFKVAIGTSTAYHVITDTGSQTTITGAVEIKGNASAVPVPVSGPGGATLAVSFSTSVPFSVSASTAGSVTSAQVSIGVVAFSILSNDTTRKQSIVCNNDPNIDVYLGDATVTTASGVPLGAGGCMSPDVPSSFTGALFGVSTAAATGKIGTLVFK